jgi:hypothetical protein
MPLLQNRSSRPRLNRGNTTYSETCGIAPSIDAIEIGAFVEHGGIIVAEGEPGVFDEHDWRMLKPALSPMSSPASLTRAATAFSFGKGKAI